MSLTGGIAFKAKVRRDAQSVILINEVERRIAGIVECRSREYHAYTLGSDRVGACERDFIHRSRGCEAGNDRRCLPARLQFALSVRLREARPSLCGSKEAQGVGQLAAINRLPVRHANDLLTIRRVLREKAAANRRVMHIPA
ncbi:hypothetical protein [Paraburkholderia sp. DGU8]|uniref:hypothetical protein n=1 Tax=Paraburkholderia sp. DGU8 TaxID=3161997 RepID=UPI00346750EB